MVDMARFFLDFTQKESCGKCVPCRVGTKRMLEILDRIREGDGARATSRPSRSCSHYIIDGTLCALGGTAPNPVLTTIKYFREEYEAHVNEKRCPAGKCKALITYYIDPEACTGCTLCAKKCPTNVISGEKKQPHVIDVTQLHQVRHLPPGVQVRRRQGALGHRAAGRRGRGGVMSHGDDR